MHTDTGLVNNLEYTYTVSATYPDGTESDTSDPASVIPQAQTVHEEAHDDGTAEAGWDPDGSGQFAAVRYAAHDAGEQIMRFNHFTKDENSAWLLEKITHNDLDICKSNEIDLICPRALHANHKMVSEALEKNILVRNWGVSSEKDLINAYNSGSKGTTIDWPTKGKEMILNYENNKISN